MNIHIYTDTGLLFGDGCRVWMNVLAAAGHDVELVEMGGDEHLPLPRVGRADVNLFVAGVYGLAKLRRQGFPAHGRNALWMLDPLTASGGADIHREKAVVFDAIAHHFQAVAAMDASIAAYLRERHPHIAVREIPYLIAPSRIRTPLPQAGRGIGVFLIGHLSERRARAETMLRASGIPVGYLLNVWGRQRDALWSTAQVSLHVHRDPVHTYFDLFRALEAWAAGTAVLAEASPGLREHGVEEGRHVAVAAFDDLPTACAQLLADAPRREAMVQAAQDLLRERFTPRRWGGEMLAFMEGS